MTSPSTITLYGIPNCDTVKKARTWFTDQGLDYVFHDFKKQGVPADRLPAWLAAVGRDRLVNRQGTTWRKLDADTQAAVQDDASASALLQAQPSVVKRPVVEWNAGGSTRISVGFAPETWNEWRNSGSKP
ncbi:Spx/MgsR family transcriptional regulator [Acidovorax soli]|jgi:Spx/MgsR family transcriptional regulator|uniref:Spx/MgsR family transcriptional regulator n=1 Tax=Acidovorax soli TaxID=592050 RepID=A0A7X0PGW4_9BURK|nr:arsenate reductase [Acidovorax soli]MBB6561668.1 Spx/MgsR family transcriptional regulator [Acidovorax soli]